MTDVCVKWSCDYCTYENWPLALTCTMCRAQRPMGSIITEEAHRVCSDFLICPESSTRAHPVESSERSRKWSCEACTYQNWPRAIRCTQCQSLRSPCEEHNRRNRADTWPRRWTCSACAHQNRPRTPNCVVCDQPNSSEPVSNEAELSAGAQSAEEELEVHPKKVKQMKNRMRRTDWLFLKACTGVVEGDLAAVEAYRSSGGDVARQLTSEEVRVLARPSAFDVGFTLVHLSIRFQRQDMMAVLLTEVPQRAVKCMPATVCPELTEQICREIRASLHQRKGDFNCYFLSELVTFTLPADIEDLPPAVQEKLFDEVLDRDVQKELEDSAVINWSLEFGSRLHALWNRSAGDCLLDSVLQATWGIYDKDSVLRRTLHDSLHTCSHWFYTRWKEWESWYSQSFGLHFSLREEQWQNDWTSILNLASQPGASLEHTHVFVLSHILRRPIIVYGVKYYKSFRGETLGYTRFQGVYLPLLWEPSFCWKSPITLGYTRGHFSALVGMETDSYDNRGAGIDTDDDVTFLPLVDSERKLLQIHFLSEQEMGSEEQQERLLRQWLDCCVTDGGMLAALQKNSGRHTLVTHMMDQWLQGYRRG